MNEDYAEGDPLAVTVGKGLANKLGNAQERKHLGLTESSDVPENMSKLYLANHTTKLFTGYTFFFFNGVQLDILNSKEGWPTQIKARGAMVGRYKKLPARSVF